MLASTPHRDFVRPHKKLHFQILDNWEWMRNAQYATDIVPVVYYYRSRVCTKLLTVKNGMNHLNGFSPIQFAFAAFEFQSKLEMRNLKPH